MKLRRLIQDYFIFSKGERTGLIVLVIIVIGLVLINQFIFSFEKTTPADREAFRKMVAEAKAAEARRIDDQATEMFQFDPNLVDSAQLARLDLPPFVKKNILRYRAHGGKFRKPADFRRIYGMTDSVYALVRPFLLIDYPVEKEVVEIATAKSSASLVPAKTEAVETRAKPANAEAEAHVLIELNQATPEDLEKLSGIGPVLSTRIVKYRNLLGGFVSLDQLREVYGLKGEVVEMNRSKLRVDSLAVRRLDINFLSIEELAAHPYISYKDARRIVDFRSKNGYISSNNMLVADSVLSAEQFGILKYYLK